MEGISKLDAWANGHDAQCYFSSFQDTKVPTKIK